MNKKADTHDRILTAASRSLKRTGFGGVTVAATMKEAGLTHGGFYAHFASQDTLVAEALERAGVDGSRRMADAVNAVCAERGVSRFRAFVEVYLSEEHVLQPENGCVVSALCAEVPRQSEAVKTVAQGQVASLVSRLGVMMGQPAEADSVAATLVGALAVARLLPAEPRASLLESVRRDLLSRYDVGAAS
jgi:AcrR family transcriptional regulator